MTDTGTIDRKPTQFGTVVAVILSTLVVLLALPYSVVGGVVGGVGLATMALGTVVGRRSVVDMAGLALVGAVVATGLELPSGGGPLVAVVVLAMAVASVVAWDVATNGIDMGEQLGRQGDTTRAEAAHAVGTATVGVFVAGASLGVYQLASGGQPVVALVFMLVAMLALVSALRV